MSLNGFAIEVNAAGLDLNGVERVAPLADPVEAGLRKRAERRRSLLASGPARPLPPLLARCGSFPAPLDSVPLTAKLHWIPIDRHVTKRAQKVATLA